MAKVQITPEAEAYLKSKGNTVITIQYEQCGGWGGPVIRPAVVAGAPYNPAGYEHQTLDRIEVYISDEIEVGPEGLVVDLGGWGPFRFLTLQGAA